VSITERLYAASPPWLQDLLITGYGLRLQRLRYGGIHDATFHRLLETERLDAAALRQMQLDRLRATLQAAASEVPFYRERGGLPSQLRTLDALSEAPLLRKAEVQAAGESMVSRHHFGKRLVTIHTGGTTGTPLHVRCDRETLQRNYAFFARLKSWAGIETGARVATFAGRTLVPEAGAGRYWRRNRAANTWLFSSYHIGPDTVESYVRDLARIGPELIDAYPSSLEPIARHLLATGIHEVHPRAIITSSETLLPEARALFESAFGCPVHDHYGGAEMVALISECEHHTLHVNPEFGVVELLDETGHPVGPGEAGEIVATGFINPVMPLIRYATGDLAVRGPDEPCACGRAFPRVDRIEGRMDDVIRTPEGHRVGRMDPVFKVLHTPLETRIVQDALDHITVEYVSSGAMPEGEETALRGELRKRLGPLMRVTVTRVEAIPRTRRGKLRTVVSHLPAGSSHGGTS